MSRQSWRVAILWMALSGYMNACLRALARHDGVEIFTSERRARSQAPFADEQFAWLRQRYIFARLPDFSELSPRLQSFEPDVLVICGWQIPAYRRVARLYRGRLPRILCMDNQWRGSLRQHLGVWARHWYIQPLFDLAWVAGSSSASFARKLGFDASRILHGLNTCDHATFAAARSLRSTNQAPARNFLYVGRLSPEKGIEVLAEGYRRYRARSRDPWPLIVCGTGPEARWLQGRDGVELRGFVQPAALPALLAGAGCYVAPSLAETWSISIHEATAAAVPVICTTGCGASAHLVQDGQSGMVIAPGEPEQLGEAMARFAKLEPERRRTMGEIGARLSSQFTPELWAETLLSIRPRQAAGKPGQEGGTRA